MSNIEIIQVSTFIPTASAILKLAPLGNAVCLSGAWGQENTSHRYDIISAAPSIQLREQEKKLHIIEEANGKTHIKNTSSIRWLKDYFSETNTICYKDSSTSAHNLPMVLGFIGYINYDYGKQLETLPSLTNNDTNLPDICGGIYLWNLINDKQTQTSYLAFGSNCSNELKDKIIEVLNREKKTDTTFNLNTQFAQDTSYRNYQKNFNKVSNYINEGDCYQINYAHRHQAQYQGSPAEAYTRLNEQVNTPYSAYLEFNDHHILSLSPERFIKIKGDSIETKPIKGTIRRGTTKEEDEDLLALLSNSTKDHAENLMIVDLLRNDLNRTCLPGTVKVPSLFEIETYPNVHHLVSTITGKKPHNTSPFEVLKQAFPGGSITGAPKIRAMEIIEELETHRRGIYCGSIFYVDFNGNMDSNICIRTLLCKNDTIYCWGGGGIVADSNCEDEYQESITKVQNLMDILERFSELKE